MSKLAWCRGVGQAASHGADMAHIAGTAKAVHPVWQRQGYWVCLLLVMLTLWLAAQLTAF